jgi:PadR family transcriptional regulator, regulatory protein PadR
MLMAAKQLQRAIPGSLLRLGQAGGVSAGLLPGARIWRGTSHKSVDNASSIYLSSAHEVQAVMSVRAIGMREPTYFVMVSMLGGPVHGSAIIKRAETLSDGRVRLAAGDLYAALDRLTATGYVCCAGDEAVAGRVRYRYELTPSGVRALRGGVRRTPDGGDAVTAARERESVGRVLTVGGRVRVGGKGRKR